MRFETALDHLSCLLQRAIEGVYDNHTTLNGMLMEMSMSMLMPSHSLLHYFQWNLEHLRSVAPDGNNESTLPASLAACKNGMVEQGFRARRAEENNISCTHLLLEQSRELSIPRGQESKIGLCPAFTSFLLGRDAMQASQQLTGALREAVIDDVDVSDGAAAQHEREADMPIGLLARTEDGDGLHLVSSDDQAGRGERSAEGSQCGGVQQAEGLTCG